MTTKPRASDLIELTKLIRLCGQTVKLFCGSSISFDKSRIGELAQVIETAADELFHMATAGVLSDAAGADGDLQERQNHGFALTDLSGRFVFADRHYLGIVGYDFEQLAELDIITITHDLDRDKNRKLLASLLEDGRPFEMIKRYIRSDTSIVWVRNEVYLLEGRPQPMLLAKCAPLLNSEAADPCWSSGVSH